MELIRNLADAEKSSAEKKLWAAVLLRGISDYKEGHRDAHWWLWSDDEHIGSFSWICDLFGVSVEFARDRVKNA